MRILGLTGSIAMGKSAAAAMFRRLGIPVWDADRAVHQLLARGGGAVAAVGAAFPGVVADGAVDRARLAARVFGDARALGCLERIVHPRVAAARMRFLRALARRRADLVVLDVPLLFETGGDALCDAVVVVSAPRAVQEARLLRRPGMDRARLATILARQMPDREKRRRADWVVPTGRGRAATAQTLREIVEEMRRRPAKKWSSRKIVRG